MTLDKKQETIMKIVSIMKDLLLYEFDDNINDVENAPFFGRKFRLLPFELGYLLNEIEKEFRILVPESYLIDPGIKTIGDFVRIIEMNS